MKHWVHAFRLRTIPLAVSSVIVGSALAWPAALQNGGQARWATIFALTLLTAVLLQVLSNLANDLGDHQHGTDNADRVGPQRAVQSGAIGPAAMRRAMVVCGLLALVSGCALIVTALGLSLTTLGFLLLGLLAIGAAVKYTYGRSPYGYAGLGDVSVFLFFGIVGVCGTCFLHTGTWSNMVVLPAVAFGLLSTGVLNVNNMRDVHNDAASGKRTLVVRMGPESARTYHTLLVVGAIACLGATALIMGATWRGWTFLVTTPLLVQHLRSVRATTDPRALDPQLKVLAMGTFLTAIVHSFGIFVAA